MTPTRGALGDGSAFLSSRVRAASRPRPTVVHSGEGHYCQNVWSEILGNRLRLRLTAAEPGALLYAISHIQGQLIVDSTPKLKLIDAVFRA